MPGPYCYDYPRPAVTVDVVAFALEGGTLRVLLIRRKHDPFAGRWAVPGGFLEIDEPVEAGARRELREETGLEIAGPLAFFGVYGDPGRDPRGRTISLAHVATVAGPPPRPTGADDAEEAAWLDANDARGLAFDHDAMFRRALSFVLGAVANLSRFGLALLPDEFTAAEVRPALSALGVDKEEQGRDQLRPFLDRLVRYDRYTKSAGKPARYRRVPGQEPEC
jgi:8-oxo-dGTP diphosphatase